MSGLIKTVQLPGMSPIVDHWIPTTATTPTPAMIAAGVDRPTDTRPSQPKTLAQIGARLTTATIRQDTRDEIAAITELMQRGEAFAELRPSIQQYSATLAQAIDFAQSVASAQWLDETTKAELANVLHEAVVLFKEKETRPRGEILLGRLARLRRILDRTSAITLRRVDVRPIKSLVADLALAQANRTAEDPSSFTPAILTVIERMIARRELQRQDLSRELRIVRRKLEDRYGDAEENRRARKFGLKRLFLHAQSIAFPDDSGNELHFTSPLADDLERFLSKGIIEARRDNRG